MLKEHGTTGEGCQKRMIVPNWFEELKRLAPTE